jgi:hypothetical protein
VQTQRGAANVHDQLLNTLKIVLNIKAVTSLPASRFAAHDSDVHTVLVRDTLTYDNPKWHLVVQVTATVIHKRGGKT